MDCGSFSLLDDITEALNRVALSEEDGQVIQAGQDEGGNGDN